MELFTVFSAAIWLGVLTSISPCPLATNIAAVSFISRRVGSPWYVLSAGMLYALGRSAAYIIVASVLVSAVFSAPAVSNYLQGHMNTLLGPILVLVGLVLLGAIEFRLPGLNIGTNIQSRAEALGLLGAALLGFLFALSFCPVSAALFFGSLLPLAVQNNSSAALPLLYGLGTAIPVLGFSVLIAVSAGSLGRAFDAVAGIEKWARTATGGIFILLGLYFIAAYVIGLDI